MFEVLQAFSDSLLERGVETPGFDLIVYQGGKCVFRHMNGFSDLENRIPMTGKERYNIYSCSKVITCTAALMLWEKGLFSLEDKLSDYMPEFENMTVRTADGIRPAKNPIRIKNLFEMTAGFSYDTESPNLQACRRDTDGRCPTREAMRYLAKDPLLYEPGEGWQYSLAHDVIAALIEVLTGEKFEDHVKRTIFDVAGMPHSTFMLPEEELDSLAAQYSYENGKTVNVGPRIIPYKIGSEYASGGAGGISTAEDYIRFLECLRTGVFLKPETIRLMSTNRLREDQVRLYHERLSTNRRHGYGLGVRVPGRDPHYEDFGWGGAAGAFLAIDLKHEMTLYFATHLLHSPLKQYRPILYRLARAELFDPEDLEGALEESRTL